jgi:hypothetical protein
MAEVETWASKVSSAAGTTNTAAFVDHQPIRFGHRLHKLGTDSLPSLIENYPREHFTPPPARWSI